MTAVEYLIEQLPIRVLNSLQKEIEQAKEMEKQQIIDAFSEGSDDGFYGFGDDRSEQYYNETYGSKGSDATSSQTEISDEEILKQGNYFFPKIEDVFRKDTWEMGAKWYREQLKK